MKHRTNAGDVAYALFPHQLSNNNCKKLTPVVVQRGYSSCQALMGTFYWRRDAEAIIDTLNSKLGLTSHDVEEIVKSSIFRKPGSIKSPSLPKVPGFKWVATSDRMPAVRKWVMINAQGPDNFLCVARLEPGKFEWTIAAPLPDSRWVILAPHVTHWSALPDYMKINTFPPFIAYQTNLRS